MRYIVEWWRDDKNRYLYDVETGKREALEMAQYLLTESCDLDHVSRVTVYKTDYRGQHCNETCFDDCHHVLTSAMEKIA